jgi:hypothetical protein
LKNDRECRERERERERVAVVMGGEVKGREGAPEQK